jgi:diguanylate cyclase (GGDEF)-like protein
MTTALRKSSESRSQLTFYYQLVFIVTAALLAMHTLTRLVLATERGTNPALILGIEGAMSLLAVLAIEVERLKKSGPTSLREWFFVGIGLLQVALCLSTGGLSSPYFLLVVMTGVFTGLTVTALKAATVSATLGAAYVLGVWGISPVKLAGAGTTEAITATVVHMAFLGLATVLAGRVARHNRETMATLEIQSKRDPLTSLENRRGFLEKMTGELNRAERFSWPISMLIIDLDHFKNLNDQYGHAVGDMVLVETSALLRETVGPVDHLARVGGEEFAVAAVAAEPHHGRDLADRILRAFRTRNWNRIRTGMRVTCSIGIAVLQPGPRGDAPVTSVLSALMQRADRALYHVKQHGRNGSHVSGAEEGSGSEPMVMEKNSA